MESFVKGVFFILVVIVAVSLHGCVLSSDEKYLNKWADDNHYQVVKVEHYAFQNGPYWVRGKGQRIWRVELSDGTHFRIPLNKPESCSA